jgi:hypothetical protein
MTVMDIFHDIHMPVDKPSIVTARGSAVVSGLAVSKIKFQNKIKLHSYLPTLFSLGYVTLITHIFLFGLRFNVCVRSSVVCVCRHEYDGVVMLY